MPRKKFDSHSHKTKSQFSGGDLLGRLIVVRHLEQKLPVCVCGVNKVNREMRGVKEKERFLSPLCQKKI